MARIARALGLNPRATKTNPRALGTNPSAIRDLSPEEAKALRLSIVDRMLRVLENEE